MTMMTLIMIRKKSLEARWRNEVVEVIGFTTLILVPGVSGKIPAMRTKDGALNTHRDHVQSKAFPIWMTQRIKCCPSCLPETDNLPLPFGHLLLPRPSPNGIGFEIRWKMKTRNGHIHVEYQLETVAAGAKIQHI